MLRLTDNAKKAGAVYVSWPTFKNAVDQLSQAVPPNKVDRSIFPGIAWAIQNQLFTGMRFLGLIDQESKPTVELEQLATPDEAARKTKLSEILHQRYSDIFALDLKKTTPAELEQKMGEAYHISGDTRDKAVRFFLSAAEYAGIELSTYFSTKKANGQPTAKRVKTKRSKATGTQPLGDSSQAITTGTSKTTVQLKSGGSLSVSVTVDLFVLDSNDRRFVFELIDKLEEYEKSAKTETPDSVAALSGER